MPPASRPSQGDWGTQFGMLIQYIAEKRPEGLNAASDEDVQDLQVPYRLCIAVLQLLYCRLWPGGCGAAGACGGRLAQEESNCLRAGVAAATKPPAVPPLRPRRCCTAPPSSGLTRRRRSSSGRGRR